MNMSNRQLLDTYGYRFWRQMKPLHLDFFMTYERWLNPMISPKSALEMAKVKCYMDLSEMNSVEQFHIRRFMEKYEQSDNFKEWLKNE
tara:strand:- start:2226 stop:2489 length:264 start_codon:yes stop_codon:yes gene_type:complete